MMSRVSDETTSAPPHAYELDPTRAGALIDAGAMLIDVRQPYEFDAGHLAGSANIEMNELSPRAGEIPKDHPVLFICRTGNRSGMATDAFRAAGWNAHNLAGGLEAWVANGRSLEPDDGEVRAPVPPSAGA
jgi:rhodanese-related sulfurtransferase